MIQEDLFEERQTLPHGLVYTPEFVSASEAEQLQAAIVQLPFREARFQQYYARRRVVHFHPPERCETPAYDDDSFSQVMPPFIAALQDKVAAALGIDASRFIHALVSEYKPGTPIGWHRDKPAYGIVVGLSLAGWGRMRFRPLDRPHDRSAMVLHTGCRLKRNGNTPLAMERRVISIHGGKRGRTEMQFLRRRLHHR